MSLDQELARIVHEAVRAALTESQGVTPLTYDVTQAAEALGCGVGTIRRLIAEGHLSTVPHMGSRVLIPRAQLEALVAGVP